MPERFTPLFGTAALILGAIGWRILRQRRLHGGWGVVLFRGDWRQHIRDLGALLFGGLIVWHALRAALWPERAASLWPNADLSAFFSGVGAVLMIEGVALAVIAQRDLGKSWRIGIEEGAKPGLVTHGLYRWRRNPIFFGMFVWAVGYTLALFTPLSLVLLFGFYVGAALQVRAEERYLLDAYGEAYRAYARRVGCFVPFVGRMS